LDTCQYKTILRADVPRVKCQEHGVVSVSVPWAEPGSGFTALFEALEAAEAAIAPAMEAEDFAAAMGQMAALRGPVDRFFESVQINTDNAIIRRNRLNLLHLIRETCLKAADLTRLEG
jgi:hypothetical protein